MATHFVRVLMFLASIVWDYPVARAQKAGQLCDLDLWYMDMAAEGAFDGDLRQEQHSVKERIEALIARHRSQPSGGRISCSTLATFENILFNSRSDRAAQRPSNAGSLPHESDRSSRKTNINLSETSSNPRDSNPEALEGGYLTKDMNGHVGVERDTIRLSSDKKMAQTRVHLDKMYTEEDDQKSSLKDPDMATERKDPVTTSLRDDLMREERDPGSSAGEKTRVSELVAFGGKSMHETLTSPSDGTNVDVSLGRETSVAVEFDGDGSVDTDDAAMDTSSSGEVQSHVKKSQPEGAVGGEQADSGATSLTAPERSSADDTSKEEEKEKAKSTRAEFMCEHNCSSATEANGEETANKIVAESFQERMTTKPKTSVGGISQVSSSQESSSTKRKRRDSELRPLWTCQYLQHIKCFVHEHFFRAIEFPPSNTRSGHRRVNVWMVCTCPRTVRNKGKQSSKSRPYVCQYYEIMESLLGDLPSNFTVLKRKPASTSTTRQSDLLGVCSSMGLFFPVAHQCLVDYQGDDVNAIRTNHDFKDNETKSSMMGDEILISGEEAITNNDMQSYDMTLSELNLMRDVDVLSSGTVAADDSGVVNTVQNTLRSDSKDTTRDTATSGAIDALPSASARIIGDTDESAGMDKESFIYLVQTNGGYVDCISSSLYVFELWRAVKRKATSRLDDTRETEEADDISDENEDVPKGTSLSEFSDDDDESILPETKTPIKRKASMGVKREVVESPAGYSQDTTFDKNNDNSLDDTAYAMDDTLNKKTNDDDRYFVKGDDEREEGQNKNSINDKRESSNSEAHHLEQLLHRQSLEQTSKIQSLELMIMKLEKQVLTQTMHEQKELTRLLQLENQIMHLENKLLRLNQSHALLHEENEKMKSRQSQYLALEHKAGDQSGPGHLGLADGREGSMHLQLVSAQQTKVTRLGKMLRSQAAVVHRLQRQYDQLEGQSKALEQLVTSQALVLSQATFKLQELAEENLKIRKKILEMGSRQDPSLSPSRVLEKIEDLLHKGFSLASAGRSPSQSEMLASQRESEASQPGIKEARRKWSDIMTLLPFSSRARTESRQRKCEGNKAARVCLYYVAIVTQCPPFSAVTWSKCPYLAGEIFSDGPTGTSEVANTRNRVIDTKRASVGESTTATGIPPPKVLPHTKLGSEGTTGGTISFGGVTVAGREEKFKTDDRWVKKSEYRTTGEDKMSGKALERLDLPPTVSVQDAQSPGRVVQPDIAPKDTTTGRFADQVETHDGEVVDVVDIPEIQPPTVLRILKAEAPGDSTRFSNRFEKHVESHVLPRPVRVIDGAMQDDENADGAARDGDPRRGQSPYSLGDPASSARLEKAIANQESATKERTNRDSAATGKASENKIPGEQLHRGGEPAMEQVNNHGEMEAEEMEKKLLAAERRMLLYPSVDSRKPRDCYDILMKAGGQPRNGAYKVFVAGLHLYVTVFCDMRGGGWTLLLRREDGSVDFYRDWKDYKEGFGGPFGEHYLGNEVVHHLTNQAYYSLQVDLKAWDGEKKTAHYRHFWLDSEDQGFRLHVLGYSGTAGDGLGKHDGMQFSTRDVDNDLLVKEMGGSCARRFQGAGWYYKCYASNIMGLHYVDGAVPEKRFDGVAWKPWRGPNYSLKEVVMKIRPISAP